MPCFEHDGLTFNYLDEGDASGQPFVFQHGLGGDVSQPRGVFSPPEGFRLLSLDCRGHGQTWPLGDEGKLSFSTFADDVVALMDYLELMSAVIGGISMGAGIALNLAVRQPKRAFGLVLSRPAWLDEPSPENLGAYPVMSRLLREHGAGQGRRVFEESEEYAELEQAEPGAGAYLAASQFGRARAQKFGAVLERLAGNAPVLERRKWRKIGVPTLVLATRRDPTHPFGYGESLAQELPRAELVEITPKATSEERHASDAQGAIENFLGQRFEPAVRQKATER